MNWHDRPGRLARASSMRICLAVARPIDYLLRGLILGTRRSTPRCTGSTPPFLRSCLTLFQSVSWAQMPSSLWLRALCLTQATPQRAAGGGRVRGGDLREYARASCRSSRRSIGRPAARRISEAKACGPRSFPEHRQPALGGTRRTRRCRRSSGAVTHAAGADDVQPT